MDLVTYFWIFYSLQILILPLVICAINAVVHVLETIEHDFIVMYISFYIYCNLDAVFKIALENFLKQASPMDN